MKRLTLCLVFLSLSVLYAQEPQSPDQQIQALRQALAQKTAALGAANAELGALQKMQAGFLDGTYAPTADIVKQIVAKVEQGNPGQTLDLQTGKLVAKVDADAKPPASVKPKAKPDAAEK